MADRSSSHREGGHRRSRSASPRRHSHSGRVRSPHRHHKKRKTESTGTVVLPYNSRPLSKRDFTSYKAMFAQYLDIQKKKILSDLDETEVKGRWKSFIGKWNRGELSDGWYDPTTYQKSIAAPAIEPATSYTKPTSSKQKPTRREEESDSDDSVGPALPGQEHRARSNRHGPSIPSMQDLELKREMDAENGLARRDDIRFERKLDHKAQKDALDDLVPPAEAGTRERQLEKKKEVSEKMKSFREKSPGAVDVPDSELMGGGDSVGEFRQIKDDFERKKNERELRKEEMLRARQAERDERLSEYKAKEEKTLEFLKQLAKQNFG
ncbi:hypothetical protein BJ878DRAFT_531976 [Calycina marina]|uniref:Uncharacterized protein n=1 Tax=Calycina marina TaxID=1763456 RepID=A0A9P8CIX5_9HELO|nr:hypothetical protein BJ878DRAFT_531976 [Calycina marina]